MLKEYSQLIQKEIYNVLSSDNDSPEVPVNFINAIDFLWKNEPVIKKVFDKRNEYNLSKYYNIIFNVNGFIIIQ